MGGNDDSAAVRLPPVLVFLGSVAAAALVQRWVFPFPLALEVGPRLGLTVLAALLGIVTLAAALGVFRRTGQDPRPWKATPEIVSTGIYGWSRNPMYVGMALLQAAIGVGTANGWMLAFIPLALALVYRTAIRHEEAYLQRKFGEAYLDYKRSVRRWI